MKLKIVFQHFHDGNDPDHRVRRATHDRNPPKYATCCKLLDLESGIPLTAAWAYCSPKDVPTRSRGRMASLGRLKKLCTPEEYAQALANTPNLWKKANKNEQNPVK